MMVVTDPAFLWFSVHFRVRFSGRSTTKIDKVYLGCRGDGAGLVRIVLMAACSHSKVLAPTRRCDHQRAYLGRLIRLKGCRHVSSTKVDKVY